VLRTPYDLRLHPTGRSVPGPRRKCKPMLPSSVGLSKFRIAALQLWKRHLVCVIIARLEKTSILYGASLTDKTPPTIFHLNPRLGKRELRANSGSESAARSLLLCDRRDSACIHRWSGVPRANTASTPMARAVTMVFMFVPARTTQKEDGCSYDLHTQQL
jgi:hypothetical protein